MLTPITIQRVHPTDLDALLTLGRKTFYDAFEHLNNSEDFETYTSLAFTPAKLLSEIKNPDSAFYFAVINNKNVGYIKLNYASAQTGFKDTSAVEVERIYILADQQGKQIGQHLIDFAINKAIEDQLKYIWLGVWEHNARAISFYERRGFVKFSSHKFMLGSDEQTDILMKKPLSPSKSPPVGETFNF
ncbi:MAG TPA: GNAT family N-acetyltransferase [Mucilaginibacter sp.]|nr:GNAT family N-acetyltransferase [Mucilaginibacter sp.]